MDPDYLAATDPTTTPQELWRIANTRPDLHQAVLAHPNIYPDLANWIVSQGAPPPAQVPSPATVPMPTPVKKRKTGLIIGLVAAALVLVVGGFLGWWFFLRGGDSGPHSKAFNAPPQVGSVVDVSTFGNRVQVEPIGAPAKAGIDAESLTLVGLRSGETSAVAGIDPLGNFALPNWIVPVRAPLDECSLTADLLNCGERSYRVKDSAAYPVAESGSGEKAEPEKSQSVLVDPTVSDSLDYAIAGGSLRTPEGTPVVSMPESTFPYYAIPSESKGIPTLVSNGRALVAVSGEDLAWSVMLTEGSSEVNGFADSEPSWRLEGEVLLIGEPEGVVALDAKTGEALWQVQTPVVSWQADQHQLALSQGNAVALLQFPAEGEEGETEALESAFEVVQVGGPSELPAVIPFEQFLNTELMLPPSCQAELGLSSSLSAFEGGRAKGLEGSAQMTHLSRSLVSGQLATVASFECKVQGGAPIAAVAAYGPQKEFLGELEFSEELALQSWQVSVEGLRGEGSAIQVVVESDEGGLCQGCGPQAQVEMLWDGDQFVVVEVAEPPANWSELGDTLAVEVAPALEPLDLGDVELSLPVFPGLSGSPYVSRTFSGYIAEFYEDGDLIETVIEPDQIVAGEIGGESFLFASIWSYTDVGGSLIGTVCAISEDLSVVCAAVPELGTGFVSASDVSVSGDLVSYNMYGASGTPLAKITQSFDGRAFTLVSDVR